MRKGISEDLAVPWTFLAESRMSEKKLEKVKAEMSLKEKAQTANEVMWEAKKCQCVIKGWWFEYPSCREICKRILVNQTNRTENLIWTMS